LIKSNRITTARLWLTFLSNLLGIMLGLLLAVIACGLIYVPIGPPSQKVGWIYDISLMPGKTGYYQIDYARVDGHVIVVRLPLSFQCENNKPINLTRQQYIFRVSYSPDLPPCAKR
jgi:hypothetical protein